MVEEIKINNPKVSMLNVAFWPYSSGEVILQNYNSILTISRLIEHSDGVINIYNDDVLQICKKGMSLKNPSYKDINSVISAHLLSCLLPCTNGSHPVLR